MKYYFKFIEFLTAITLYDFLIMYASFDNNIRMLSAFGIAAVFTFTYHIRGGEVIGK